MPAIERPASGTGALYTPRAAVQRRRPAQPRRQRTDLVKLATRLTARDLWLCDMLHEHRVLTTHHVAALWNTGHRSINRRLRELFFLRIVDSFRPLVQTGSAPEHYILGRTGAEVLAATRGTDLAGVGWRKDLCARAAFSPTLGHDLAVNTLLSNLAATHHRRPDEELALWLAPRSAKRLWGDWIHPDAYAHWHHGNTTVPFFLEHDTGSERPLARVEGKLSGFANLAATTGTRTVLLIHTSTTRRETALRGRLTETARTLNLPLATSNTDLTSPTDPSGPVWLPVDPSARCRLPLTALATHWPNLTPAWTADTIGQLPALGGHSTAWPWQPVPPLPPAETTC